MIKAAVSEMTLDIFYLLSYVLNTESYFTTDQVETVVACQISGFTNNRRYEGKIVYDAAMCQDCSI